MDRNKDYIQIANEFSCVHVRKVSTRNGERLEIDCKKSNHKILLDAMQLEAITLLKPEHFSKIFEMDFGVEEPVKK
jgi:hypothetical protein